jgi:G3E family GTPase
MKTTIVCGLLGSGKTTFIQQIVKNSHEKTVVLVNDFGESGIDGEIFSADGIESIELPSGCVCCTLKTDLITTVKMIIEKYKPESLIIEPSGIASPSGVLEALEILKLDPITVVGIIDTTEFIELYESQVYGTFFKDQIINSDMLLINKTDLAEHERIVDTTKLLEELNPGAVLFKTVRASINEKLPFVSRGKKSIEGTMKVHFETISIRFEKIPRYESIKSFFYELKKGQFGNVARAKALVRTDEGTHRFDYSYGAVNIVPFQRDVSSSRLVIIGTELQKKDIDSYLK